MGEIVHLQQVQKWAGEGEGKTEILRGISLSLQAGEFIAIMGASGSGKSTLLNLIGLLDTPSAGTVRIMDKEISNLHEEDATHLRARAIGFIFQSFNLLSYLTAEQNVQLPMAYAGSEDSVARSRTLLHQMNMGHRLGAYPATLSGGEKQRVAIARALANRPGLLLADEPTGSLDSRSGAQIMDLLADLHHQGVTVMVVTHDEAIARRAQRIVRMRDGRLD